MKKLSDDEELTIKDFKNNQHWIGVILFVAGLFAYFSADSLLWAIILGGVGLVLFLTSNQIRDRLKDEEEAIEDEFSIRDISRFYRKHKNLVMYSLMLLIIIGGFAIRISNLPRLGDQLLGLDPYLFHRYSEYIVETGSLPQNDTMRYYPFGFNTRDEGNLHSYVNAWAYNILNPIFPSLTLIKIFQIYPAFFGALAFLSFYFLVQELFEDQRISLVSTAFLTVTPGFVFRTTGGFADKEAIAIFLIFTALWMFIKALKTKDSKQYLYAAISGFSTGLCGLSWGGIIFVFMSISVYILAQIAFDRLTKKEFNIFLIWFAVLFPMFVFMTNRYGGFKFFENFMVQPVLLAVFLGFYKQIAYSRVKKLLPKNVPPGLGVFVTGIILAIILTIIILGVDLVGRNLESAFTIFRAGPRNRHAESVSENQEPVFYGAGVSWVTSIGWILLPYFFGMFMLPYALFSPLKKYKFFPSIGIFIFTSFLLFSNFSRQAEHQWIRSIFGAYYEYVFYLLILGMFVFYSKIWRKTEEINKMNSIWILLLVWNILSIMAGRTSVRNIFSATPSITIISAYALVKSVDFVKSKTKDKLYSYSMASGILLFILVNYYVMFSISYATVSQGYVPNVGGDWFAAFNWIKDNTPEDSVFIHWWDYGYWIQSLADRTTVLDGGNYESPAYAAESLFTSSDPAEYNEVLDYYGQPTHMLIVDDDIPKFFQIARIGLKDVWFTPYYLAGVDQNIVPGAEQFSSMAVYQPTSGPAPLTNDIIINGVLYPQGQTSVLAVLLPFNEDSTTEPIAFLQTNTGEQITLAFNCRCQRGTGCEKVRDDGINECFVDWGLTSAGGELTIPAGLIFMPNITQNMLFTKLYVTEEPVDGFTLVYDNGVPKDIQNLLSGRTNVQIWEITYEEGE